MNKGEVISLGLTAYLLPFSPGADAVCVMTAPGFHEPDWNEERGVYSDEAVVDGPWPGAREARKPRTLQLAI